MRQTLRLGRFAGVPVEVHWSVVLVVALIAQLLAFTVLPTQAPGLHPGMYWLVGLITGAALMGSVLVHELAHVVVARRCGIRIRRVTLWLIGGVSEMESEPARPGAQAGIAVAGPLTSLVIGGALVGLVLAGRDQHWPAVVLAGLSWLAVMNVLLGAFNLLPASPLDGGRVLHGVVWRLTGDRERGRRVATLAGQMLGSGLTVLGVVLLLRGRWDGLWLAVVGWFLARSAVAERSTATLRGRLAGLRVRDVMRPATQVAPGWWTVAAFVEHLVGHGSAERGFPIVDFDGRPVGELTLTDLARLGADARLRTRVQDAGRPLPAARLLGPDAPAEQLLALPPSTSTDLVAVAVEQNRLVGVITRADLMRTLEVQALRPRPGPDGTPPLGRAGPGATGAG
ncbi:site-2 protease family protein [Pseudonocardia acidicola]|uniref:Zinc metalloprotease n=1 Tax=Pseudonocardia acidicola TaxID=2724939 RepID=A0ABX1SHR8_9PSEU|nr:site-2 protease family protein [Pseudonocardia acidicola]NMI00328.1 CBS domain-containing protein [Pseudonocardia acidicola]